MFCPKCGAKNQDGARFCLRCGTPMLEQGPNKEWIRAGTAAAGPSDSKAAGADAGDNGAADAGAPAAGASEAGPTVSQASSATAEDAAPESDDLAGQVKRARSSSRRRIPVVMFIVLVVLTLAATAFAATMIYRYVIQPALEEQQTAQVQDTDADEEEEEEQEPAVGVKNPASSYTTEPLTDAAGNVVVPALTFDMPKGWSIEYVSDDETEIWARTDSSRVILHISSEQSNAGGTMNNVQQVSSSRLGSDAAVGYERVSQDQAWMGLYDPNSPGSSSIAVGNGTVGFHVDVPGVFEQPETDPNVCISEAAQVLASLREAE